MSQTDDSSLTLATGSPKAEDAKGIDELFERSFHTTRSRQHWLWKYGDNPFGTGVATISRTPTGDLAAHYAGYPVRFRISTNESALALHIGDIMTAREVRGVGRGRTSVMARTTDQFYRDHCTGKVDFNFGFNTSSSKKFSLRFMGAVEIEDAPLWHCDIADLCTEQTVRGYRVQRIQVLSRGQASAFDRLFQRTADSYGPMVERGSEWVRWRYLACPTRPVFEVYAAYRWGRLVGWSVFRSTPDALRWCDSLVDPRHSDCAGALLQAAINAPRTEHDATKSVQAWFSERPAWWAQTLRRFGFERAQEPNGIGMVCVPHRSLKAPALLQRSYYSWGDSDLA